MPPKLRIPAERGRSATRLPCQHGTRAKSPVYPTIKSFVTKPKTYTQGASTIARLSQLTLYSGTGIDPLSPRNNDNPMSYMSSLSMTGRSFRPFRVILTAALACLALAACGSGGKDASDAPNNTEVTASSGESGFLGLFGGSKNEESSTGIKRGTGAPTEIGVNSFLWRASLDTVSFMPLTAADPFGGVIITDWYSAEATPDERFKLTVYILDKRLRADGLRVSVFRQVQERNGNWRDASVSPDTAIRLENAILIRARQLRIDTIQD